MPGIKRLEMIEHDVNIYSYDDYIEFLEEVYISLRSQRPDYSQRDFARDLDIPAPRINQVLNRKEGLSVKRALLVSKKIDMSEMEREYFSHLVSFKTSKSKKQRETSREYVNKLNHNHSHQYLNQESWSILDLEGWDIVWNYLEIESRLESLRTICMCAGMKKESFNEIILAFIEHDLIGVFEGRAFKKKNNIAFGNSVSSRSIQNFHIRKLEDSIRAVKNLDNSKRKNESMTFSLSKEDIKVIEKRMEAFLDELRLDLSTQAHDQVYTINLAFHPAIVNGGHHA